MNQNPHRERLAFLRDVAPLIIPWWNGRAERCGFPLIPDDWVPWSDISNIPKEGLHDSQCFFISKYANREMQAPIVLGVHFAWSQIGQALHKQDMVKLPLAHAVNLNRQGQVVDFTWGAFSHSIGLMVGRAFGIAPTSDLKTYVKDFGFTI